MSYHIFEDRQIISDFEASFQERMIEREVYRAFLNHKYPILLKDINLKNITDDTIINKSIISSLRISQSDGIPETIMV